MTVTAARIGAFRLLKRSMVIESQRPLPDTDLNPRNSTRLDTPAAQATSSRVACGAARAARTITTVETPLPIAATLAVSRTVDDGSNTRRSAERGMVGQCSTAAARPQRRMRIRMRERVDSSTTASTGSVMTPNAVKPPDRGNRASSEWRRARSAALNASSMRDTDHTNSCQRRRC